MKRISRSLIIASASLLIALGSPVVAPLLAFAEPADAVVQETPSEGTFSSKSPENPTQEGDANDEAEKESHPDRGFYLQSPENPAPEGNASVGDAGTASAGADEVATGVGAKGGTGTEGDTDANAEGDETDDDSVKAAETPTDGLGDDGSVANVPPVRVDYDTHVQNIGWGKAGSDGSTAGTTGQGLRVEALSVKVSGVADLGVQYKAHVQNVGWQDWVSDGTAAGTTGQSLRVEALRLYLTGAASNNYTIWYRVHAQNVGWMGWAHDGELAGTAGMSYRVEALQVRVLPAGSSAPAADGQNESMPFLGDLSVSTHVQNIGWQDGVGDPKAAGTTGRSLRVEAIKIAIAGHGTTDGAVTGGVSYRAHVQNVGWQDWVADGAIAGTTGQGLRVEALQAQLTGDIANKYDLYYRVHVSNIGWMPWAENGGYAGTQGMSARVEAVQLRLVPVGSAAPADDGSHTAHHAFLGSPTITYSAYVQGSGWQSDSSNGGASGVTGKGLRTEAMRITLSGMTDMGGGVQYRVLGQNGNWQDWAADGAVAGYPDSGQMLQALQVSLTGDVAQDYDVYYRAHIQNGGWLNWTRDGGTAGSVGQGLRIEAYQVCLRAKLQGAPGETLAPVYVNPTAGQQRVIDAAKSTPSPGGGLCAMWISQVFKKAGEPYAYGDANDMYYRYCTSSNEADIKPGMVIAVAKHNHSYLGGIYGHIGVYVGNGQIMDNVGYIRTTNFHEWTSYYGQVVSPKWGWLNHIALA